VKTNGQEIVLIHPHNRCQKEQCSVQASDSITQDAVLLPVHPGVLGQKLSIVIALFNAIK
jgi:hypothetical protein